MNIIFTHEMDRTSVTHVGQAEPPHFMVDIQRFCYSWVMYRKSPLHGRWPECPKNQPSTDNNYLSVIEINVPTPSPTTYH